VTEAALIVRNGLVVDGTGCAFYLFRLVLVKNLIGPTFPIL
jgi:hypothetical protein